MNKDLVYVCSPLGAPTEEGIKKNMLKAKEYVKTISEKCNCRAIAPHSFCLTILTIMFRRKENWDLNLVLI